MIYGREVVLELMREIFEICEERKLRCCISGEFLIMPFLNKEIRNEAPRGELSMPFSDLCELEKEIKKKSKKNRKSEWFFDNKNLKDITFSYVSLDTLYYDARYDNSCEYHGIRILIKPIFNQACFTRLSNFLMNGWRQHLGIKPKKNNLKNNILQIGYNFCPNALLKLLKHRLVKEQRYETSQEELFTWSFNFGKKLRFNSNYWNNLKKIKLEEIIVCVPDDMEGYASVLHGKNWKQKDYNKDYMNYLSNPQLPFRVFIECTDMSEFNRELLQAVNYREEKKRNFKYVNAPFMSAWEEFYSRQIGWHGKEEKND